MKRHSHDAYDDQLRYKYSWDSSVPNHRKVLPGDVAIFWDKQTWLGLSVLQSVHFEPGSKTVYKCPSCSRTNIQRRTTRTPAFRCNVCHKEFDTPVEGVKDVWRFWAEYPQTWHELKGQPLSTEIRALSLRPESQLSLRDCSTSRVEDLLKVTGNDSVLSFIRTGAYS